MFRYEESDNVAVAMYKSFVSREDEDFIHLKNLILAINGNMKFFNT